MVKPSVIALLLLMSVPCSGVTSLPATNRGDGSDRILQDLARRDGPPAESAAGVSSSSRSALAYADGEDGASPGGKSAVGTFRPNPIFLELPDNTAMDLGRYECRKRMPQIAKHCEKITDFSRFNYDPYQHRIVMFGGGHSASGRTDIDALDLNAAQPSWQSVYPSMSCEAVAAKDTDPRGFHNATGHPVARHTYDMSVITGPTSRRLLLLSTEGFSGHCHPYNSIIQSVASYPLGEPASTAKWHYSSQFKLPWSYHSAAEYDAISEMVIVVGSTRGSGEGGMWVYDPVAEKIVRFVDPVAYSDIDNNLVYFPPTGKMYLFVRSSPTVVMELTLDRDDWSKSRATVVATSGEPPPGGTTGYAYDARNEIIGGGVSDGKFYTFDPLKKKWSSQVINLQSTNGATLKRVLFHLLDYDPVNNIYIIISGKKTRHTWAYRYKQ